MWLERWKIFKYFYNNRQHTWKDCGLNYSLFLKSLNYVKCINFQFADDQVDDYKNPKKNPFVK